MLDITKINYSQKKIVGKQHTWNNKQWFEEEDGIVLYQHSKEIWIDTIPTDPTTALSSVVQNYITFELTMDTTVQNRQSFYAYENGVKIGSFITPSYGIDYTVNIYVDGIKIPTSHPSQPIFDYANGVLTFENPPPLGIVTVTLMRYIGKTFAQYLDREDRSVARGVMGVNSPEVEYIIQHNMGTFDIDITLYVFDEVEGSNYWKKDIVPMILMDENRIRLQMSEPHPIRYIIKSYEAPSI